MVMSAVSSVSTPGVLVTMMPRLRAVSRSMLSTPVPKLAMSRSCGPAWEITARSIAVGDGRHQHVGDLRPPRRAAPGVIGLSSTLRRASNSSRMRVSTTSGSLRVTMTIGFLTLSAWGIPAVASAGGRRTALGGDLLVRAANCRSQCLTDGHCDDKVRGYGTAARAPGARAPPPEPATGLICDVESWFGRRHEMR